jgi:hypothetical protein
MRYPKNVQHHIDNLKIYKENENLESFQLFHLYSGKTAYPRGYYDSRWFELIGYNYKTKEFKNLGEHDGLTLEAQPDIIRIFADGSTVIRFKKDVLIYNTQDALIEEIK